MYYIAINYSGLKGDVWGPAWTSATVIASLEEVKKLKGYVILDEFALRMIENSEILKYFQSTPPNAVIQAEYSVYIWIAGY